MIYKKDIKKILEKYDKRKLTIGSLGGHSALDVCRGAKDYGFNTVVVCQKGREKTYSKYFKTMGKKGVVDNLIVVDNFKDIVKPDVVEKLQKLNTIFIHSRYFWVYCNFEEIESDFKVPIFGTRNLLRAEERTGEKNQYTLMKEAGLRYPVQFNNPKDIDGLVLVKASEAYRGYERAFFFANSYQDYLKKSKQLISKKLITEQGLKNSIIEEYIIGVQVNFNFFYSALDNSLELLGTDARRQTNIDGLIRIPANEQLEILKTVSPKYIESGHIACTVKESLLEKAFEAGERFVEASKKICPPGIIGPFALQGAIIPGPPKEEFVVFDLSLRIPGSPGTMFTPYSGYLYGESMSYGKRIALEIKNAVKENKLLDVVT
jgi:5-formaminoimidazole-4-carboxamide-1-(beta)-D-ribofuranosyl 5'-monophosphate synthetase